MSGRKDANNISGEDVNLQNNEKSTRISSLNSMLKSNMIHNNTILS